MKPAAIRIFNNISDSFFYMGKLFILTEERQLKFIENKYLFDLYLTGPDPFINNYLERIFFSNDSLPYYKKYDDPSFKAEFMRFWILISNKKFEFQIRDEHLTTVCNLPENEALDFVIYAQRAYLANRDGLFECILNIEGSTVTAHSKGFQRIFDSKSINVNPRAGKVLVSTKTDGLFAGSINSLGDALRMGDHQISSSSVRTGWADYNFVNYSSQTEGNFFYNKTEEKTISGVNFSIEDGGKKNMIITEIGVEQKNLNELFVGKSKRERIIFTFNSLTKSFNISDAGKIYLGNFQQDLNDKDKPSRLSDLGDLKFDIDKLGYPLSAYTVAGGTVYEFFDRVILLKKGKMHEVCLFECKQIRTFASSKWFQNVLITLSEDFLEIHSVHPYE